MDSEDIRRALRAFTSQRGISIADWSRRARISPSAVYAFLNGETEDIGSRRLIALADAEDVSLDDLLGRSMFDFALAKKAMIELAEKHGGRLRMEDVATATNIPVRSLMTRWSSVNEMIIDAYISVNLDRSAENIGRASGTKVLNRLETSIHTSFDWYSKRREFYTAYQAAILTASDARKRDDAMMEAEIASQVKREVLDAADYLLILDDGEKYRLAVVLVSLFHNVVKLHGQGSVRGMTRVFMALARTTLSGRISVT